MKRRSTICLLSLLTGLSLPVHAWAADSAPRGAGGSPSLEIPEVVVEGSDPSETVDVPVIKPSDPTLESEFALPPVGASASERDLASLHFRTDADLFPNETLPWRDARTSLHLGFGGLDLFSGGFWDARQAEGFNSFWQGDWTAGTALVAPWQRQRLSGGIGFDRGDWRFSLGAEGDRSQRLHTDNAGQAWGIGRLSATQTLGQDTLTYRGTWESGLLTAPGNDAQSHGGDLTLRYDARWGDHRPYAEGGGGYHWALANAWPTANLLVGDRIKLGAATLDAGLRYQMIGGDHSLAPALAIGWRGWPETLLRIGLDGGQQAPYQGSLWRTRPYAQIGADLRSEHTLARAALGLERRLVPGLVLGLGAEAAGVDRRLYWSQVSQGPYWQLQNATGPMLVWGGKAGLHYELGPVTPFLAYEFQQATANDAALPTDGRHDLRGGLRLQLGSLRAETSAHLLAWALSAAATGQGTGAQPNFLLLDCSLAYDITDNVQLKATVTDWLLRSHDTQSGFWEPAFTALGGIGIQF